MRDASALMNDPIADTTPLRLYIGEGLAEGAARYSALTLYYTVVRRKARHKFSSIKTRLITSRSRPPRLSKETKKAEKATLLLIEATTSDAATSDVRVPLIYEPTSRLFGDFLPAINVRHVAAAAASLI